MVERQRTEIASAEAAAVVRQRELHLGNRRDAALRLIHRMVISRIRQRVHPVEHFPLQRRHRRVLHQHLIVVILDNRPSVDGVLIAVLLGERLCIQALVRFEVVVIPAADVFVVDFVLPSAQVHRTADIADLFDRNAAVEQLCKTDENRLTHAVGQNIRAGIDENRSAHLIIPVIVVRKAPQRRFQSAKDDRHVSVRLPDAVAVDNDCTVGTVSHFSAGGIVVVIASALGCCIMRNHGVDVACRNEESESGSAEPLEIIRRFVVRLAQHRHAEALCLQHARNDRRAERRMVYICISADIHKVRLFPAARGHILIGNGKKFVGCG